MGLAVIISKSRRYFFQLRSHVVHDCLLLHYLL